MNNLRKQSAAEEDLINIWLFSYEHWGLLQADQYLDQLEEVFRNISENPLIGTRCDEIRAGYLKYPANRHMIFYRITHNIFSIVRVLGGEMNYIEHLN